VEVLSAREKFITDVCAVIPVAQIFAVDL
jgi:hypothetical protein